MPTKVGIRCYKMTVCRTRTQTPIRLDATGMALSLPNYVEWFVMQNLGMRRAAQDDSARDRHWRFEPDQNNSVPNNRGVIRYGISGFESDLIDSKANRHKFRRQTTHVEIIPLFYEFWFPSGFQHGFAVFQSFAARSCVELVSAQMRFDFSRQNPGFSLHFQKLLPTGAGGIYDGAPVKGLRLIRRNASSDVADRYLNVDVGQAVNFEIIISARRKGFLGKLGDLTNSMKAAKGGVIEHDGVIFDEAVAEIDFAGQRRRVGLFGSNSEAGVIDLTEIQRASDGHPLFAAISKESTKLLADFQAVIGKQGKP